MYGIVSLLLLLLIFFLILVFILIFLWTIPRSKIDDSLRMLTFPLHKTLHHDA